MNTDYSHISTEQDHFKGAVQSARCIA